MTMMDVGEGELIVVRKAKKFLATLLLLKASSMSILPGILLQAGAVEVHGSLLSETGR